MTALASHPLPSKTNWEESIVPTLRKRLENESRILSNRLSTHSITLSDDNLSRGASSASGSQKPAPSSTATPRKERSTHRTPPATTPIPRYTTDSTRPSAIPRPSMNRDASDYRQNANGNGVSSPPLTNNSIRGVPGQRTRTRSSPYAFDHDDKDPRTLTAGRGTPTAVGSGIPTPAQSRSNSPMASLPPSERPSRIPTAAAKRARSNSNAASSESAARSAKRPSQSANAKPPKSAPNGTPPDHGFATVAFPPSPDPSPELWLQNDQEDRDFVKENSQVAITGYEGAKIRDEAPPFNPNRASRVSFEEREFEHWYRGEGRYGGGRNGGRGEIKVAKVDSATEMLEIAVGGHKLSDRYDHTGRMTRRRADSLTNGAPNSFLYDEPELDPHMDYVMDERPLTDVDTDLTDYDHGHRAFSPHSRQGIPRPSMSVESESTHYHEPVLSSRTLPVPSSARRPSSDRKVSTSSGKSTLKTSTSTPRPSTEAHPRSGHSAIPSSRSANTNGSSRGATTKPTASGQPPARSRSQSRHKRPRVPSTSQSTPKPPTQSSKHTPLVDAVPWTQPDYISKTGNWDDVVLPTLAKKMGLSAAGPDDGVELNALGGGFNAKAGKRSEEQAVYEPAPGTFGYDPTKRRPPKRGHMNDFSGDQQPVDEELYAPPVPMPAVVDEPPPSPPIPAHQIQHIEYEHPIRKHSPPPFSNYTNSGPPSPFIKPPPVNTQPAPVVVVVAPPMIRPPHHQQKMPIEDEQAGCCKCVIM